MLLRSNLTLVFVREDIFEPGQLPVSESIEVWYLPPQFGSTPKKAIPQPVSTVRQPKSIQDMDHGELFELVSEVIERKRKKNLNLKHLYIQTHHHHLILQKLEIYLTQE